MHKSELISNQLNLKWTSLNYFKIWTEKQISFNKTILKQYFYYFLRDFIEFFGKKSMWRVKSTPNCFIPSWPHWPCHTREKIKNYIFEKNIFKHTFRAFLALLKVKQILFKDQFSVSNEFKKTAQTTFTWIWFKTNFHHSKQFSLKRVYLREQQHYRIKHQHCQYSILIWSIGSR